MQQRYWRLFVDAEACWANTLEQSRISAEPVLRALRQQLGAVEGWDQEGIVFHLQVDRLLDFVYCFDAPAAVSLRARETIEPLLGPEDEVLWLPVTVQLMSGERVEMYFIRPLRGPDLIDEAASQRVDGPVPGTSSITVAVFERTKVGDRQLFAYAYGTEPVVSDRIRGAIEAAGLTGIEEWSPVPVV